MYVTGLNFSQFYKFAMQLIHEKQWQLKHCEYNLIYSIWKQSNILYWCTLPLDFFLCSGPGCWERPGDCLFKLTTTKKKFNYRSIHNITDIHLDPIIFISFWNVDAQYPKFPLKFTTWKTYKIINLPYKNCHFFKSSFFSHNLTVFNKILCLLYKEVTIIPRLLT